MTIDFGDTAPDHIIIPYKYCKFIGILYLLCISIVIAIPIIVVSIEPQIDIVGALFYTPYPSTHIGWFVYPLKNFFYQLSWKEPLITLWFYCMYIALIIYLKVRIIEDV